MDPISEAGTARGHALRRLQRARQELDDAFHEFVMADGAYNFAVAQHSVARRTCCATTIDEPHGPDCAEPSFKHVQAPER